MFSRKNQNDKVFDQQNNPGQYWFISYWFD